ncbi:MAG: hypothetical protein QOC89_2463 [Paraburkholderia sp.]|jgi:threonine/homoserine/homoserine lactone efflux protein|uniref:hypothetical protein n=1 Tax=Paraburkholderia sp. TaxID=1926495 RepID=UPI002B0031C9|nr:hypothetical protein [Paraburkholderia sp.]MEA3084766.1 hypothetical protein [Paraburkholderia sp.]
MSLSALLVFALALTVAAGTPGPSIAALVARAAVRLCFDQASGIAGMPHGKFVMSLTVSC